MFLRRRPGGLRRLLTTIAGLCDSVAVKMSRVVGGGGGNYQINSHKTYGMLSGGVGCEYETILLREDRNAPGEGFLLLFGG